MWWATEFNGALLPRNNFNTQLPRTFVHNRMMPTGAILGEYDLEGSRNRLGQQQYEYELTIVDCDPVARMDNILGSFLQRGILKITDGRTVRRTTAKIVRVTDPTTIHSVRARQKLVTATLSAEPYWYDEVPTTVNFTGTTTVSLRNTPNIGNARAIKYVVLTITSNITQFVNISINPTSGNYYNEFLYGTKLYSANSIYTSSALTYVGYTSAPLVIDAGKSTVKLDGVDVYANVVRPDTQTALLWIEPGDNTVSFSQAVSGNIQFRSCWV